MAPTGAESQLPLILVAAVALIDTDGRVLLARRWSGMPVPLEGQELAWVRPARLADYPMPPADRPLVALLQDLL
jgi:hypothetical protein